MTTFTTTFTEDAILVSVDSDISIAALATVGAFGVDSFNTRVGVVTLLASDLSSGIAQLNDQVAMVDFRFTGFTTGIAGTNDTVSISIAGSPTVVKQIPSNMSITDIASWLTIDSDVRVIGRWFAAAPGQSTTQSTLRFESFNKGLRTDLPTLVVTRAGNSQLTATRKIQSTGRGN